jgi:hypothetical protein
MRMTHLSNVLHNIRELLSGTYLAVRQRQEDPGQVLAGLHRWPYEHRENPVCEFCRPYREFDVLPERVGLERPGREKEHHQVRVIQRPCDLFCPVFARRDLVFRGPDRKPVLFELRSQVPGKIVILSSVAQENLRVGILPPNSGDGEWPDAAPCGILRHPTDPLAKFSLGTVMMLRSE